MPMFSVRRSQAELGNEVKTPHWYRVETYRQAIREALRNSLLRKAFLVGARRLELQTSSLSGTRSNQLSYAPESAILQHGGAVSNRGLRPTCPIS